MMDAVWSSVVVVLAFLGTFTAIDASLKSAERDVRRTTAYELAQNEMDRLRKLGDRNVSSLLAVDDSDGVKVNPAAGGYTRKITINNGSSGVPQTYWLWTRAYYKTGIDSDLTDACGTTSSTAGAQYIFVSVTITWDGMPANPAGSTAATGENGKQVADPALPPVQLESYYAPEGGDLQTNTSTLMIFLKDRNDNAIASRAVSLYKTSTNTQVGSTVNTNANGCVLFTNLARSDYEVRAVTTGAGVTGEHDLYGTTNPATLAVKLPARSSLVRTMRISQPVVVGPTFMTTTAAATDVDLATGPSVCTPRSSVTGGSITTNCLIGPWVAASTELASSLEPDFQAGVMGRAHLPLTKPTAAPLGNRLFPLVNGYVAYAGPCDVNDPDDSALAGSERVNLPTPSNNSTWAPGLTYVGTPVFKLRAPSLRTRVQSPSGVTLYNGQVQVRLVNRAGSSDASSINCGSRQATHYNRWIRLPGRVSTVSGATLGYLADSAYALPDGKYDVCAIRTNSNSTGSTKYYARTLAVSNDWITNGANQPSSINFTIPNSATAVPGGDCGDPALWD